MFSLDYISAYSILVPTIIGLYTFKRSNGTLRKLSVLVFFTAIAESVAIILSNYHVNNLFAFHLHTLVEMILLSLIFKDIYKGKFRPKLVIIVLTAFLVYSVINVIYFEQLNQFNANQRYIAGIIIILFALLYYQQMFQELAVERLETHPYFWFCSSLFIYFAGTLFLFIIIASRFALAGTGKDSTAYWDLRSILNINLNLGYSITLWMGKKLI